MAPTRDSTGVIAQLTRGQNREQRLQTSSPPLPGRFHGGDSTVTSFQPDQESTQQFNTAADVGSWADEASNNDQDTMDQSDDSRSIELGRGIKGVDRNAMLRDQLAQDYSEEQLLDLGDTSLYNLSMAAEQKRVSHEIIKKHGGAGRQYSGRPSIRQQEAEVTKTSDIVPIKTRFKHNQGRRTLSDMHAKVNRVSDSSFIQADVDLPKPRSSRFASMTAKKSDAAIPTVYTTGMGLRAQPARAPRHVDREGDDGTGHQTVNSFMLPDLPNISELVSGLRKDGTPVFSRTTKPRSRFASANIAATGDYDTTQRPQIRTTALPEEEKVIFTSLQLLKEKVAGMEKERLELVRKAAHYENEMNSLRSQMQLERRLRGQTQDENEDNEKISPAGWRIERGRLNATIKTIHDRVERTERTATASEAKVQRITQERDSLITQLGVAFYSNEELKEFNSQLTAENERLEASLCSLQHDLQDEQQSNKELRHQLEQAEDLHSNDLRRWTAREAELKARYKQRSSRQHSVEQSEGLINQNRRIKKDAGQDTQVRIFARVEQEVRNARAEAVRHSKTGAAADARRADQVRSSSRVQTQAPGLQKRHSLPADGRTYRMAHDWLDGFEHGPTNSEMTGKINTVGHDDAGLINDEDSKDITEISFLDPAELSALRKKLETERIAAKNGRSTSATGMERKSSLRTLTVSDNEPRKDAAASSRNVRVQSPETADAISYSERGAVSGGDYDTNDLSMLTTTSSRRPHRSASFEEMTSAFILPDITVQQKASSGNQIAAPAADADVDVDTTAATVRPAQDPRDALASVLAQLQDEVSVLKQQLGDKERAYAAHDPSFGKRKRLLLKGEIDALLAEVERRSEWVYRLTDVVEGQRKVELELGRGGVKEMLGRMGVEVGGGAE